VIVIGTLGISLAIYELAIRRWSTLRFLFGLKRDGVRVGDPLRAETAPSARY
jgi:hypothetical protein